MDKKTCNPSIRCDVSSCAHHTAENCCCLSQIQVGCCGCTPTKADGTECSSFAPSKGAY